MDLNSLALKKLLKGEDVDGLEMLLNEMLRFARARGRFRRVLREIIDDVGVEQVFFTSNVPVLEPLVSNRRWVEILRALLGDSSDGIKFTEKEVETILGGNAAKLLNL